MWQVDTHKVDHLQLVHYDLFQPYIAPAPCSNRPYPRNFVSILLGALTVRQSLQVSAPDFAHVQHSLPELWRQV